MIALARNLDLFGTCFLAGWTAAFIARLHRAPAWQMRALVLLIGRHHVSPLSKSKVVFGGQSMDRSVA